MNYGNSEDSSDESDGDDTLEISPRPDQGQIYIRSSSRRPSAQHDIVQQAVYTPSRRGSNQLNKSQPLLASTDSVQETPALVSPAAAMVAWRDQLAAQIHQFQQSVNWTLPNLPALPPMPTLPDPQAYPMVRRVSSLLPHRPSSRAASSPSGKDRWWEMLTGSTSAAPPAYEDLYPDNDNDGDMSTKKASAVRAAADAALDEHFGSREPQARASSSTSEITNVRIGRNSITEEQQKQLRLAHAQKVKGLRSDRTLFWFWLPVLIVLVALMVLDVRQHVSQGYQYLQTRYIERVVEVA